MPSRPKYVVAVSGGVDSVVLLDVLCKEQLVARTDPWSGCQKGELIVAHFDHGIRDDSADDEAFVRNLAAQYGCKYVSSREELGKNASEERARERRYVFLRGVCEQYQAHLIVAHHANDVAETIAINIHRGTGWRGVAVMDATWIRRPLLGVTKNEIETYASDNHLEWREDSTNHSDIYLRNRLRPRLQDADRVWQLAALRARQVELKRHVDRAAHDLIGQAPYSRYFMTHCGDEVAIELLRAIFIQEVGESPARPMRTRALHAIKVARAGTVAQIGDGVVLRFTRTHFIVESSRKVLS